MRKHRIVIETDNPKELARDFIAELTKLLASQPERKTEIINDNLKCGLCGLKAIERRGINKNGKPYHAIFCTMCDNVEWLDKKEGK